MIKLPNEVERLGPEIQSWLESQLLDDLRHYGIHQTDLHFDWSAVSQEGHCTEYRGRMLESLDNISIRESGGNLIANGWMDFINTSVEVDAEPTIFWLFLSVSLVGVMKEVKKDPFLPQHVWDPLTDTQKQIVATMQQKWLDRDPNVQEWARKNRHS